MNTTAILHVPGTVDACPLDGRMHLRLRAAHGDLKKAELIYCCNKFKWHERKAVPMRLLGSGSEFDYYGVDVELTDTRFAYLFCLTDQAGERRFLSEDGLTRIFDHTLSFFSYFQYTSIFPEEMPRVPEWVKTAVAYQIFPDRFHIGSRDRDLSYVNAAWGAKPHPKTFCGGDLAGITEKLPYLKALGVGLIYLNPVFCSPSNHHYDIEDYRRVDPHLGGNEALRTLIERAHALDIRVMLDGVFNHCSHTHPFFQDVAENGRKSPYYDWFFIDGDRPDFSRRNYRTFADVPYMPKLNTMHPQVIDYFAQVGAYWLREFDADGWRLDVSDELSHSFLRAFRRSVIAAKPNAIIIGEDWHRAERSLNGDEYDGLMNYALSKACMDLLAFETETPTEFCDRLLALYHRNNVAAAQKQLNLLDSHDTDRFLTRVGGNAEKYRLAAAVCFFFPGIPCVYYGDEIGIAGGYDPDCRRCFDWEQTHWDHETHDLIGRLARLKKTPALSRGGFSAEERDGIVTLRRSAPEGSALLIANVTSKARGALAPYAFRIEEIQGGE